MITRLPEGHVAMMTDDLVPFLREKFKNLKELKQRHNPVVKVWKGKKDGIPFYVMLLNEHILLPVPQSEIKDIDSYCFGLVMATRGISEFCLTSNSSDEEVH